MYRILIVDDEPLVLIGLQGMLEWQAHGFEICGTARNGKLALDFIRAEAPDIVISDIKMPLMDGITLAKTCRENGVLPLFILLTSFEDFHYAQQALHYGVVEYLIKLELTADTLLAALVRAQNRLVRLQPPAPDQQEDAHGAGLMQFRDRFWHRLYTGQIDTKEVLAAQAATIDIALASDCYLLASCEVLPSKPDMESDALIRLVFSTMRMVESTLANYLPCYATGVDLQHFYLLFCMTEAQYQALEATITPLLEKANQIAQKYFSVTLRWAVGAPANSPLLLAQRAKKSELLRPMLCEGTPVIFSHLAAPDFDTTSHKARIVAEVQEYICNHLSEKLTLNDVAATFSFSPNYMSQLFAKYGDSGFVEFITETRIARAKQMLAEGNLKIYEIADALGFESAFYFSKVFKKIVGISPREYQQQL